MKGLIADPTPTKTTYEIVISTGILEDQNRSVKEIDMGQFSQDFPERLFQSIRDRRGQLAPWLDSLEGQELAREITTRIAQTRDLHGFVTHVWDIAEAEMPYQLNAKRVELKRLNQAAVQTAQSSDLCFDLLPA